MPLNIDFQQVLLHMLNFVILAGGLTLILFKPVNNILRKRKETIEQARSESRQAAAEAEAMKSEYEQKLQQAQKDIDAMHRQAEAETTAAAKAYIDAAKEKADAMLRAAEAEAEGRKEHILEAAQAEIGELVVSAAQKLLSDTVTPERNAALYDEFIRKSNEELSK